MAEFHLHTKLLQVQDIERDSAALDEAAAILQAGGLVAMPTETVYGLAGNALSESSAQRIYQAKGRPSDNPLIVHISDWEMILPLVRELPPGAKALADAYWPGPLTMILPKSDLVPLATTGGLDSVAIRLPAHPVARELIRRSGLPLSGPSANLSGRPSPTTAAHCVEDLTGRVEAILDGGACTYGVESTVLTLCTTPARVLRPGAITPEQIAAVLGEVEVDDAVTHPLADGAAATSPGMKYRHYAPKARVSIVEGSLESFARLLNDSREEGVYGLVFTGESSRMNKPCVEYGSSENSLEQAHALFYALRELDERGAKRVYARCPSSQGVGLAVFNRLLRAASFEIIQAEEEADSHGRV